MKAFVYHLDDNGRVMLPGIVVGPYANRRNLENFGLCKLPAGRYRIEAPRRWEKRYSQQQSDFETWEYRKFGGAIT
jgi:hypothetical protein